MKKQLLIFCLLTISICANAQDVNAICCKDAGFTDKVRSLDAALADIQNTVVLDLAMQSPKITAVPANISKLVNLQCLDLSFNRVSTLPASFVNLEKLECIDLSGNHYLQKLPTFLNDMPNLKVIKLEDLNWSADRQQKTQEQFPNITFVF